VLLAVLVLTTIATTSTTAAATSILPSPTSADGALVIVPEDEACTDSTKGSLKAPAGVDDHIKLGPTFNDGEPKGWKEAGPPAPPFVATEEWQVVQAGQSVPAGLHVSIDMQTGQKKAKLMEEQVGIKTKSEMQAERMQAMQDAIKKSKQGKGIDDSKVGPSIYGNNPDAPAGTDYNSTVEDGDLVSPEAAAARLDGFLSHLELLKAKGLRVNRDSEIMVKLVSALQNGAAAGPEAAPDSEIIVFLEELVGFVHQIDNAVDLNSMGGLKTVLQFIKSSVWSVPVRAQAAVVIGTSASNNPQATANALGAGALEALMLDLWPAARAHPGKELKRVLFGTAALLQHSPEGMQQFVKLNGPQLLAAVLSADPADPTAADVDAAAGCTSAAKNRAVSLASDMMLEQAAAAYVTAHDGKEYTSENLAGFDPELWHDYASKTEIATLLGSTDEWCSAAAATLESATPDMQEPLLQTFIGLASHCKAKGGFNAGRVAKVAERLRAGWAADYVADNDDFYLNLVHIALAARHALEM